MYWDEQGAAIAALQTPLYPDDFWRDTNCNRVYFGGLYSSVGWARGVMTKLLREAFYVMRGRKIPVSTLIPASEWLYDYYGKMGYAPVFDYTLEHYTILDKPVADHFRVEAIREVGLLTDDLFNYFQSMMRLRPCCVQHEREDFEVIVESLRMDGGALIVVYSDKNIVGMAFAEPRENHALVLDGMA